MKEINYSTSRVWTNKELAHTCKDAKANSLVVTKEPGGGFTTITDPETGDIVLRSLPMNGGQVVRFDQSYFDPEYSKVYLYIDGQMFVCYAMDYDNETNRNIPSLKRFVVLKRNLQKFFSYYQLRYHPRSKMATV